MSCAVALEGVACVRGGRLLFEGLKLALAPGDALLVTGANGAGKSSLLRILAGLLRVSAGRVTVEGPVAWLGEAAALDSDRTLASALAFWARLDRAGGRLAGAMAAMGIADLADLPVRMLSTGQRRRAALARVIAAGAPVWLLDEPAGALDGPGLAALDQAIAGHRAGGGIAVVATHQPIALPGATELAL